MKTKKNPKFDLEAKRKTFFLIGLTISLAAVLVAFKGTSEVSKINIPDMPDPHIVDEILIPPTKAETPLPPPPPKMKIYDVINITDDPLALEPNIEFPEINDPLPDPVKIEEETHEDPVILFPEEYPKPPGGMKNLNHWLSRNLIYPEDAIKMQITGRVYVNFVVGKDGSISDIKVIKGVDKLLDDEALRVVSEMPKWKPGKQNGKPVKVSYSLFITFKLN